MPDYTRPRDILLPNSMARPMKLRCSVFKKVFLAIDWRYILNCSWVIIIIIHHHHHHHHHHSSSLSTSSFIIIIIIIIIIHHSSFIIHHSSFIIINIIIHHHHHHSSSSSSARCNLKCEISGGESSHITSLLVLFYMYPRVYM